MNFWLNSCGNNVGLSFHIRLDLSQSFTSVIPVVCWFSFILLPSPLTLILNQYTYPDSSAIQIMWFQVFPPCFDVMSFVPAEVAQPLINCFDVTWLNLIADLMIFFLHCNFKTWKNLPEHISLFTAVGLAEFHVINVGRTCLFSKVIRTSLIFKNKINIKMSTFDTYICRLKEGAA